MLQGHTADGPRLDARPILEADLVRVRLDAVAEEQSRSMACAHVPTLVVLGTLQRQLVDHGLAESDQALPGRSSPSSCPGREAILAAVLGIQGQSHAPESNS